MKLETKFNTGDIVWKITNRQVKVDEACSFCSGTGNIVGKNGAKKFCPECYGRRVSSHCEDQGWNISQETPTLTIGQIRCEYTGEWDGACDTFANYGPQKEQYNEKYMCRETGIGSGSLFKVDVLFGTKQEALDACNELNAEEK